MYKKEGQIDQKKIVRKNNVLRVNNKTDNLNKLDCLFLCAVVMK